VADYLCSGDAGIKPGTRGVITKHHGWNSLEARLDTGRYGQVTVRVKHSQVRVTRRGGGIDEFRHNVGRVQAMRMGVALAFVLPIVYFAVMWFIRGGTKDGLIVAVLNSAISGAVDLLAYIITKPLSALIYLGILTVAGRFAFR
jgi:hypothetical protein